MTTACPREADRESCALIALTATLQRSLKLKPLFSSICWAKCKAWDVCQFGD